MASNDEKNVPESEQQVAPRFESTGHSQLSVAVAGVRAQPLPVRLPNATLISVNSLTEQIGYALVAIPDSWVVETVKKEVLVVQGEQGSQSRIEPLASDDWQLVRELCGGNPPSRCSRENIEAWRARFDSAARKPDWDLHVTTRSSDEMTAMQKKWVSVVTDHQGQIERQVKAASIRLITASGIETTDAHDGFFRIADAKAYLDSCCLPWADATAGKPSQPDALVNQVPAAQNWRQRVRDAATEWCEERIKSGLSRPTKKAVSDQMAVWCRNNDVTTDNRKHPSSEYLRKHVLRDWKLP